MTAAHTPLPGHPSMTQHRIAAGVGGITRRADTMGGQYCIAGTRMPVTQVKSLVSEVGRDWVKREFPWITGAQIDCCLAFRATPPVAAGRPS